MEATGIYWKPVWHILEGRFQQILANAAHINGVPGRKSDTNDAAWIADLLAHGLIRGALCTAANPRTARSDADQEATHARDRAAHPAQSALVVARISADCCVSVPPATAAPIHAAVTGASSFCNGVLRTSGRPVAESSAAFGRCPRTHKPINRSLASAGAGVGWLGPADWLSIADDTRSPVGFPYHKPWQIEHRDDPYALECRPSPATYDDTSASPRCIKRLCHRRAHGGLFATGEGWRSIYAGGGSR